MADSAAAPVDGVAMIDFFFGDSITAGSGNVTGAGALVDSGSGTALSDKSGFSIMGATGAEEATAGAVSPPVASKGSRDVSGLAVGVEVISRFPIRESKSPATLDVGRVDCDCVIGFVKLGYIAGFVCKTDMEAARMSIIPEAGRLVAERAEDGATLKDNRSLSVDWGGGIVAEDEV